MHCKIHDIIGYVIMNNNNDHGNSDTTYILSIFIVHVIIVGSTVLIKFHDYIIIHL